MNGVEVLVNGVPGEQVSVRDRGFQYGDGVFETLAVARGAPLLWERHLARLKEGAARLGIAPPPEATLRAEAARLCVGKARAVLKIVVTRGVSGRGYAPMDEAAPTRVVRIAPWPDYPARNAQAGVALRFCRARLARQALLAGIKHLNRLEQVLARAEWRDEYAEGLMLDDADRVIEGTMSNVFVVKAGGLRTPDVNHCGVAGIMRGVVMERAQRLGLDCRVAELTRADLWDAEEVFLTNSLIGLWPVRRLEDAEYAPGPVTRRVQEAIRDVCCHGED